VRIEDGWALLPLVQLPEKSKMSFTFEPLAASQYQSEKKTQPTPKSR